MIGGIQSFLYRIFYHYNDLPMIAYTMTFYDVSTTFL